MGPSAAIVVIGDVALDYTIEVDPISGPDEKVKVSSSSRALGGTAANTAAQIVKLGSRAELVSTIGDDVTGRWLRGELERVGVGSAMTVTRPGFSTYVTILRKGNERSVYVDLGVGDDIRLPDDVAIGAADLIYVGYAPQVIVELVRRGYGPRLVVGLEHWMTDVEMLGASRQARLIITNSAGQEAFDLASFSEVVVTHGAAGVELWRYGRLIESIPAEQVEAVDATGAGDSFAGALCHSLVCGSELLESMRFAIVAAALSTLTVGAQEGQPTTDQINSRREEN
ncbi:MAG: carbohydrate kinase family protein [Microbacteriaceae bacterium]